MVASANGEAALERCDPVAAPGRALPYGAVGRQRAQRRIADVRGAAAEVTQRVESMWSS